MKLNSLLAVLVGVTLNLGLFGTAHATLQGRDLNGSIDSFEAYYDTDLNITWLADANYTKTSGYSANGRLHWFGANYWAANLGIVDAVNNITYDNWRLPTVKPINGTSFNHDPSYNGSTDRGFNISEQGTPYAGSISSEMAHLFYNTLNNKGLYSPSSTYPDLTVQTGWGLTNSGPFANIQVDGVGYWSDTATEFDSYKGLAWDFDFYSGGQYADYQGSGVHAWAVSDGDVGIAAVPEASTYAMMLAGLALVGVAAKRRKQ